MDASICFGWIKAYLLTPAPTSVRHLKAKRRITNNVVNNNLSRYHHFLDYCLTVSHITSSDGTNDWKEEAMCYPDRSDGICISQGSARQEELNEYLLIDKLYRQKHELTPMGLIQVHGSVPIVQGEPWLSNCCLKVKVNIISLKEPFTFLNVTKSNIISSFQLSSPR